MPARRLPTQAPEDPDAPTLVPRLISGVLIAASLIVIFGFSFATGRALALPDKLTMGIIALGVLAGLLHIFGVVPQHRQMRAFASPVVAWPVMAAGIATLVTS